MVEAVAVVVEAGFGVEILSGEAVAEEVGERARLGNGVAKGVVGVMRYNTTTGVEVAGDVAVVVVSRDIGQAVDGKEQQTPDTASALRSARQILAPEIAYRSCRAVGVGNALFNEVPVVIEERHRRVLCHLLHAARLRIVEVGDYQHTIRRHCFQAVGGIVCEGQDSV